MAESMTGGASRADRSQREPAAYGKVAVLMGGWSAEREISLKSGSAVLSALQRRGVNAHGVDAQADVLERIERDGYDRVFIALHGRGGEDGVIQGALEVMGMPYTGSGVLGSALSMDKLRTKRLWVGAGIPTPDYMVLDHAPVVEDVVARLGLPVIVKPVHEGSSIGMTKVEESGELGDAWHRAAQLDDSVIAERWIHGAEYTAAVLDDEVLPLIRLETPREFYDFEAKYQAASTRYVIPCGLPEARERELQGLVMQAFSVAGATGWGRVDLMMDETGAPWFIEINTVPGMTDHSLVPMAAKAAGLDFDALVLRILDTSYAGAESADSL